MSNKDINNFSDKIIQFATSSGVNARKVMGDIASDTNLTSIYLSRGEDYLKNAAVQAAKMGKSMGEVAGATSGFLDIENSSEMIQKINQLTGSNLNALEMFTLTAKGDTTAVMKRLGSAFSSPQGMGFLNEWPGLASKFAQELGFSLKDIRVMAGLGKEQTKEMSEQEKKQLQMQEIVKQQANTMDQVARRFDDMLRPMSGIVVPALEKVGPILQGLGTGGIGAIAAAMGLLTGGFLLKMARRGSASDPMHTIVRGNIGGGGDGISDGVSGKKRSVFKDAYKQNRGVGRGGGRMSSLLKGGKAAMGSMKGMSMPKLPKMGMLMSALMFVPSLMDAWNSKDWTKIIPGLFNLGGSILGGMGGAAIGALAGGVGAVPGSVGGSMAGGMAGDWLAGKLGFAAKGRKFNSPTLAMVGEENRSEIVIPTERIRNGMPVDAGVARELGSIGVPGFAGGFGGAMQTQSMKTATRGTVNRGTQGSMADAATQRQRSVEMAQMQQKRFNEQRSSLQEIENKAMEILEEERSIASDVKGPMQNFVSGLNLWDKAKKAAKEYAQKTSDRFFDHLKKNNGDVMGALKATWKDTVKDLEGLQEVLYSKLGDFANQMAGKGLNWLKDRGADLAGKVGNKILDILPGGDRIRGNKALNQNFNDGVYQVGEAGVKKLVELSDKSGLTQKVADLTNSLTSKITPKGGVPGGGLINSEVIGAIFSGDKTALAGAAVEGVAKRHLGDKGAGISNLAKGDFIGAGKASAIGFAKDELKEKAKAKLMSTGIGKSMAKIPGIGGAGAAGALGAGAALMQGDVKGALKGGAEGIAGHLITAGLTPFLGPFAPLAGSILAGPAVDGLMTGGKEMGKGFKNMGGGVKDLMSGNFKEGFKGIGKGALGVALAPGKAILSFGKSLGGVFGFGGPMKPGEARAKLYSRLSRGMRDKKAATKIFDNKSGREWMSAAIKGGDKNLTNLVINDLMKGYGVSSDIAMSFISAVLNPSAVSAADKGAIDAEFSGNWLKMVDKGGWQARVESGERWSWKKQGRENVRMRAQAKADGHVDQDFMGGEESQRANARAETMAKDGLDYRELGQLGLKNGRKIDYNWNDGNGVRQSTGDVYLNGQVVGKILQTEVEETDAEGVPTRTAEMNQVADADAAAAERLANRPDDQ